ncbi:MAG: ABC transporter substrate-binding protein [Gammaproteobacteria bacterium]
MPTELVIGYLQLKKDARYSRKRRRAEFLTQPLGRPYSGAKIALSEVKFHGAKAGATFGLRRERPRDAAGVLEALDAMMGEGVNFFVMDLPAKTLAEVAKATAGREIVLFNVSAREDALRGEQCQPHLLHIVPSQAMLSDALAQRLISKKWKEVLVLVGPQPADRAMAASFERSAKRFGLDIADRREFELGNDPRKRSRNNIALLTANEDYDVVYVADSTGEFARDAPYNTIKARPIVGSGGLAAAAWHWAWERHGAPQLENRFEETTNRHMRGEDWSAWMAVKAVAAAVQRTESIDFAKLRDYLLSPDLILDGFKGNRSNFRPWDRQLRQPILLVTQNWVVDRAPIEGFLHRTNKLDTLGFDERDSPCKL